MLNSELTRADMYQARGECSAWKGNRIRRGQSTTVNTATTRPGRAQEPNPTEAPAGGEGSLEVNSTCTHHLMSTGVGREGWYRWYSSSMYVACTTWWSSNVNSFLGICACSWAPYIGPVFKCSNVGRDCLTSLCERVLPSILWSSNVHH